MVMNDRVNEWVLCGHTYIHTYICRGPPFMQQYHTRLHGTRLGHTKNAGASLVTALSKMADGPNDEGQAFLGHKVTKPLELELSFCLVYSMCLIAMGLVACKGPRQARLGRCLWEPNYRQHFDQWSCLMCGKCVT